MYLDIGKSFPNWDVSLLVISGDFEDKRRPIQVDNAIMNLSSI